MRVLAMHNHHQAKGGAMEVLAHEAELLAEYGHEVSEYTVPAAEELGLPPVRAGLKAVWNAEVVSEVSKLLRSFQPDVVHVHTPFPTMSPAVFQVASRQGFPTVTTVHSYRYSCIAATCHRDGHVCEDCVGKRVKLPGLIHRCYHESVGASAALTLSLAVHRGMGTFHSAVDRFIALTSFSKNLLVRDGIPVDKIVVKANSVPDPGEPAAVRGAERSVVFAGRLMEIKGVHTLLDAWAQAAIPGLRLRIAGDGSLRQLVEERASSDPSIEYLGWVKEDDVQDMMAGADAVIVPSEWYEGGVPLVALRSFSVGPPVIISDLPSLCEEVLADGTGFTFRVGDSASLALALRQLDQQGPASRSAMRAQARRTYLERYAPQANAEQLEAIYSTVIAERAANRSRAPRSH